MEKILIPLDGSEPAQRAVEYVAALVRAGLEARIGLLNVQPPIRGDVRIFVTQAMIDNFHRSEGEASLRGGRAVLEGAKLPHEDKILVGHPAETIAAEAEREHFDRIVMGCRGAGPFKNLIVGSVATQVIHAASVPVTLVK